MYIHTLVWRYRFPFVLPFDFKGRLKIFIFLVLWGETLQSLDLLLVLGRVEGCS